MYVIESSQARHVLADHVGVDDPDEKREYISFQGSADIQRMLT